MIVIEKTSYAYTLTYTVYSWRKLGIHRGYSGAGSAIVQVKKRPIRFQGTQGFETDHLTDGRKINMTCMGQPSIFSS